MPAGVTSADVWPPSSEPEPGTALGRVTMSKVSPPCWLTPERMLRVTTEDASLCRRISGSAYRSLVKAMHMPTITTTNGSAATMVICCRPVSASDGSSPPASSITAATAPIITPQKITIGLRGSSTPYELIDPMMIEAESAPVTKKMPTSTMINTMLMPVIADGMLSASIRL